MQEYVIENARVRLAVQHPQAEPDAVRDLGVFGVMAPPVIHVKIEPILCTDNLGKAGPSIEIRGKLLPDKEKLLGGGPAVDLVDAIRRLENADRENVHLCRVCQADANRIVELNKRVLDLTAENARLQAIVDQVQVEGDFGPSPLAKALPVLRTPIGFHADFILIDDPIDPQGAMPFENERRGEHVPAWPDRQNTIPIGDLTVSCWKCGKRGSMLGEFTSPHTGLCVECSGKLVAGLDRAEPGTDCTVVSKVDRDSSVEVVPCTCGPSCLWDCTGFLCGCKACQRKGGR